MKKLIVTGLITLSTLFASEYSFGISPTIGFFKGKNGKGINVNLANNEFIINYTKLNGDFDKKEIGIENKYFFFENQTIKTDNLDKTNNFIGLKYTYYLLNNSNAQDIFFPKNTHFGISFLKFKAGVSLSNNNPYLIGASFNYAKEISKNLTGYTFVGINRYSFGTEFLGKISLLFNF
jgi:hypothetical protein